MSERGAPQERDVIGYWRCMNEVILICEEMDSGSVRKCRLAQQRQLALFRIEPPPPARTKPLERPETGLVGHALRFLDPVAQVDIGQAGTAGADDVVEDDEGAEPRSALVVGLEEAV